LEKLKLVTFFRGSEVCENTQFSYFEQLGISDALLNNLNKCGFSAMTPIQKKVIPLIINNQDIMGCSQTGSGKTVSFLAPMRDKLLSTGPPADKFLKFGISAPICLILVPTRELAEQIYKESRKLCYRTGITVAKVYGGVGYDPQKMALEEGCDILVATPGRLIDFIKKGNIKLNEIKHLIIDEADRILDMGFEDQLKSIIYEFGKSC
jgi:superfamily II DNA/RNA helicase